jgi:HSP20 family protein
MREMENLHRRLSSLWDTNHFRRHSMTGENENMSVSDWSPLVDITEDDDKYQLKVELPGVRKEDVHVTVENGTLFVAGERKAEKEEKNRKYHRVERSWGRFERSFTIPDDAQSENVKADFKDGVLCVHLAKSEKARPRQIEVKVN